MAFGKAETALATYKHHSEMEKLHTQGQLAKDPSESSGACVSVAA